MHPPDEKYTRCRTVAYFLGVCHAILNLEFQAMTQNTLFYILKYFQDFSEDNPWYSVRVPESPMGIKPTNVLQHKSLVLHCPELLCLSGWLRIPPGCVEQWHCCLRRAELVRMVLLSKPGNCNSQSKWFLFLFSKKE